MNQLAFIFTHGPHGNSIGREGLDAMIATLSLTDNIGAFFISDGVFLLLAQQKPNEILARDFISTFGVLSIYGFNKLYLCSDSAAERGLQKKSNWILNTKWLSAINCRKHIDTFDVILTF